MFAKLIFFNRFSHYVREMPQSITITTLAELYERNYSLRAYCQNCMHSSEVDLERLAARLGPDYDYVEGKLAQRMKCSECGAGAVSITIAPPTKLVPGSGGR
jgi:hypothetical protein